MHVTGEAGRQFDGQADLTGPHALIQLSVITDRRTFDEVARTGEIEDVIVAGGGLIPVEHRKGEILNIQADAVAHDEHQYDAAQQSQGQADRIPSQLKGFSPGIAEQATETEPTARCSQGRGLLPEPGSSDGHPPGSRCRPLLACISRLFKIADEGLLQRPGPALLDQRRRCIADQHPARVHQRDPVAPFGLVHEMGGDEDGHLVPARQVDHHPPEGVPGNRINPRSRFVEDQHLRPVDHRHRQGEPLSQAKRQGVGEALQNLFQTETPHHLLYPSGNTFFRYFEQAGMEDQVLPHRQLAIQGEGLSHIADPPPGVDIVRVHRTAEQPGLSLAGGQQAGEHLHGGGLAAAVGTEEAEDLSPVDSEAYMIDGGEIPKAHGQVVGLDGSFSGCVVLTGRDDDRLVAVPLRLGQQGDERLLQRRGSGLRQQCFRGAGGKDPPAVHRHQPVETRCLLHVGSGYQYAHARLFAPNTVDQPPELASRQRVDAGCGLVEDKEFRIVDQGAAEPQFLFHAAGELTGGTTGKRPQAGCLQQLIDAPFTLLTALAEQTGKKIDILEHRQRRIEIPAQSLGHVGHLWANRLAMAPVGHAATQHMNLTGLDPF